MLEIIVDSFNIICILVGTIVLICTIVVISSTRERGEVFQPELLSKEDKKLTVDQLKDVLKEEEVTRIDKELYKKELIDNLLEALLKYRNNVNKVAIELSVGFQRVLQEVYFEDCDYQEHDIISERFFGVKHVFTFKEKGLEFTLAKMYHRGSIFYEMMVKERSNQFKVIYANNVEYGDDDIFYPFFLHDEEKVKKLVYDIFTRGYLL